MAGIDNLFNVTCPYDIAWRFISILICKKYIVYILKNIFLLSTRGKCIDLCVVYYISGENYIMLLSKVSNIQSVMVI